MEERSRIHFASSNETEKRLKKADDALPEDIKAEYPIQSMEYLKETYKDKWIAVLTTTVDNNLWPTSGRLVATAGKFDRPKLEEQIKPFEDRVNRSLHIFYTGEYESFSKEMTEFYVKGLENA